MALKMAELVTGISEMVDMEIPKGRVAGRVCGCRSWACGHLGQWEKGGKLSLLDIQGLAVTRGLKLVELWRSN